MPVRHGGKAPARPLCDVTVAADLTNIVLDALFVAVLSWGLEGAAATVLSQCVGGIVPLLYFGRPNTSLLRLTRTKFDEKALLKTCTNGSSELMSNTSISVVSMLYNVQLLMYVSMILQTGRDSSRQARIVRYCL